MENDKIKTIQSLLSEFDGNKVDVYVSYLVRLSTAKKKDGTNWIRKNPWIDKRSAENLANCFKVVSVDGLDFDGIDITLQSTGISYNYQAFKNKMFLSYPESIIDVSLVYEKDKFEFSKKSGHVEYTHEIGDPFSQDEKLMVGAYCVIKNKRGEFLTLLSSSDINKHRKVAKTDYIWRNWPKEMALKTIMKKACKQHFKDIYQNIETIDNENYDLDNSLEIEVEHKSEVEEINTVDELRVFYEENVDSVENKRDFNKLISTRKAQIENEDS